jgi:hypothetical protein
MIKPENLEIMRTVPKGSPYDSARRHALTLLMSKGSLFRILHTYSKFHPYKMKCRNGMSVIRLFKNDSNSRFGEGQWPPRSPDLMAPHNIF